MTLDPARRSHAIEETRDLSPLGIALPPWNPMRRGSLRCGACLETTAAITRASPRPTRPSRATPNTTARQLSRFRASPNWMLEHCPMPAVLPTIAAIEYA